LNIVNPSQHEYSGGAMRARTTIAMPCRGAEYAHRLAEGAVTYLTEHPGLRAIEIPYRIGPECPVNDATPPFDGAWSLAGYSVSRLSP